MDGGGAGASWRLAGGPQFASACSSSRLRKHSEVLRHVKLRCPPPVSVNVTIPVRVCSELSQPIRIATAVAACVPVQKRTLPSMST
jgi:hypothetical protein